eukprot:CAMPEP_0167761500 /NCGR_PEP_ID=MMETSP0110_2-20121227/12211_1 /TAXON_ID=629695 /ORGANISM="Gymnochlora sp., Strain CCMP2014" /LENGTH=647 /DNA_ID=CAMNT_0007648199 /DNA_START=162 /DNA_END=2105 /DNA_ORIENTATION=+
MWRKPSHCILYCHGASGGRLDGITDAWELAMQLESSLCVFDFAGCGKSEGTHITLGLWEEDDVRCLVIHLIENMDYKHIVLWGRSMGAVSCIRFASHSAEEWIPPPPPLPSKAYESWTQMQLIDLINDLSGNGNNSVEDSDDSAGSKENEKMERQGTGTMFLGHSKATIINRIQHLTASIRKQKAEDERKLQRKGWYMKHVRCLVLDSPFASLWDSAKHIIEHYRSVVPAFMMRGLANVGLPIVRKSIMKQIPEFDIKVFETLSSAKRCEIPAVILHAVSDSLIPWKESRRIYDVYGADAKVGDKGLKIGFAVKNSIIDSKSGGDKILKVETSKSGGSGGKNKGKVSRQYILIDGDHNSLRPAGYYDAVASFLSNFMDDKRSPTTRSPTKNIEYSRVPAVVPFSMQEREEMRFFYGVAVVSEFTDEEVRVNEKNEENEAKKSKQSDEFSVFCTVKTVSFSWRMVLGLHKDKGILVFRPYSGTSLYAISFAELLSFQLMGPSQLRFMFLDRGRTQRRIRFYSPEAPVLKEMIDRAIRNLVNHENYSGEELLAKVKANLAGASAALVEKRLVNSRGLKGNDVAEIIASLLSAIKSMFDERDEGIPEGVDPVQMVEEAVIKAVQERTNWTPDLSKINLKHRRKDGKCVIL